MSSVGAGVVALDRESSSAEVDEARRRSVLVRATIVAVAFVTAWMVLGVRATPSFADDGGSTHARHHTAAASTQTKHDKRSPVRDQRQNKDACLPTPVRYGPQGESDNEGA